MTALLATMPVNMTSAADANDAVREAPNTLPSAQTAPAFSTSAHTCSRHAKSALPGVGAIRKQNSISPYAG